MAIILIILAVSFTASVFVVSACILASRSDPYRDMAEDYSDYVTEEYDNATDLSPQLLSRSPYKS